MTFDRKTIVLSRPVAGLACKIRLSLRQYRAIALVASDESNVIRLLHRDPGLSVDLWQIESFVAAEEYRDRLAVFLDLPPLMLAGGGAPADEPTTPARAPRRRSGRSRRPRFLTRRRTGAPVAIRKIEGREIIARR